MISLDSDRLVWDELDVDKKTRSFTARMDVNFADDDWQNIYAWMVKTDVAAARHHAEIRRIRASNIIGASFARGANR